MLTEKEIRDKLFEQYPTMFRQSMSAKNYNRAKSIVDTVRKVALFIQLPEEDMDKLFGVREEKGAVVQIGLYPEELILQCEDKVRRMKYRENKEMMELIRKRNKKDA